MFAKTQALINLAGALIFLHALTSYVVFNNISSMRAATCKLHDLPQITTKPLILMWSKYYAVWDDIVEMLAVSGRAVDNTCCQDVTVTVNRSKLAEADVVVFFSYPGNMKKSDMPSRLPHQVWVLFGKESPHHSSNLKPFNNLINWTMTYRQDSDIWNPYGYYIPTKRNESITRMHDGTVLSDWILMKSRMISAVISHCPTASKREKLILALREANVSVDTYGGCGEHKICHRLNTFCDHEGFWRNLSSTYRFYFAAENSLCKDYITEKFWRPLKLGMVPLVYGGSNYTDIAPPNSFIDIRQFPTLQQLKLYLQWLAETPAEYAKYCEWRRKYDIIITDAWHGWCKLCRLSKVYAENKETFLKKNYGNIQKWWKTTENFEAIKSVCTLPPRDYIA